MKQAPRSTNAKLLSFHVEEPVVQTTHHIHTGILGEAEIPWLRDLFVEAFASEPVMRYIFPDDETWKRGASWFFERVLLLGVGARLFWTDDKRGAASMFRPEHDPRYGIWQQVRAGILAAPFSLGFSATRRLMRVSSAIEKLHRSQRTEPIFYLEIAGVLPSHQGKGVGTALLCRRLEEVDSERRPAYVMTANPIVVSLYKRHGFRVAHEEPICAGGPMEWVLRREMSPEPS